MKKVAIISLRNINNIGEDLLDMNTEFLVRISLENVIIDKIELFADRKTLKKYFFELLIFKLLMIIAIIMKANVNLNYKIKNFAYRIKYKNYFKNKLSDVKAVIYAVGMLKYTTQDFSYIYELINSIAKEYNIPVMMSAMSIEKYNEKDCRCRQLVRAVNNPAVKCITTRDNEKELEILRNEYLIENKNCYTECVADPALWTKETYQINDEPVKSDLIGIGLIRLGIYEDYGYNITKEQLFDLYVNIVKELDERKLNWVLFCNGMPEDYEVGLSLLKKLNLSQSKLLSRPETPKDLINMLLSFKCIMGARLHSCIASYALGIPVVDLIWDNKLRAFAKKNWMGKIFY